MPEKIPRYRRHYEMGGGGKTAHTMVGGIVRGLGQRICLNNYSTVVLLLFKNKLFNIF
jgi:hypothetical protein